MLLTPNDEQLVARVLAGDRNAFRVLAERHYVGVYRLCRSILKSSEDSEDATQEIFVRAFQALAQYAGRGSFGGWLRRMTVNHCLNRIQSSSARHSAGSISIDVMAETLPASEERLLRSEAQSRIRVELNCLPAAQRSALGLRLLEGLSYEEIADIMGVPVNSVRSWLHRGRARLRCALESEEVEA